MNHNQPPRDDASLLAVVREWHAEIVERVQRDQRIARARKQVVLDQGGRIEHDAELNYLSGRIEASNFAVDALAIKLQADLLDPSQFLVGETPADGE